MYASRHYALVVGLTVVYYLAGRAGLHFFGLLHPSASAIWIPTGIAIASLLIFGNRVWPAIFTGALLVNLTTQGSFLTSLGIAAGNTLEGILAAYLVGRFAGGTSAFTRASDIFRFAGIGVVAGATVSATIGVASLTLGGYAPPADVGAIWFTWWLGDAAGGIVVTPLLVLWYTDRQWSWPTSRVIEAALLLGSLVLVGSMTFFHPRLGTYPLSFLCLAPLVWGAFRFGPREMATAVVLLALIATWATATGNGPFVMQTSNESLLVLQGFMTFMAMTTLSMAALTSERAALLARERKARAEAEAAARAKDEFLAILSHELRNPLSAISAAGAVLNQTDEAGQSRRWKEIIHRQTEQLTRLIDDMLDIAKVTVGKMPLARQAMDLAEAVERCVRAHASERALLRIEVQCQPAWIDADPNRIAQVIENLLDNAVKYTPATGSIRVSVTNEGRFAILRVEDSGAGIAPEFLPHVFDPFLQGEQGLERPMGGLGIGLTLVRRLTEMHGGTVEAHSAGTGRGSAFVVRLPRINAPPTLSADVASGIASADHAYKVLIVEDNSDARQALRALLELAGCTVHEACDGSAGIESALRLQLDFILLDIGLPHLDGYEVARRLKALKPAIRLVALTGYGREEDKACAAEAGFDAYLVKPVDVERLLAVMHELFSQQQQSAVQAR